MNTVIVYQTNPTTHTGHEFARPAVPFKPCPHCGGSDIQEVPYPNGLLAIMCQACYALGPAKPTIQEAWYWWCHRA